MQSKQYTSDITITQVMVNFLPSTAIECTLILPIGSNKRGWINGFILMANGGLIKVNIIVILTIRQAYPFLFVPFDVSQAAGNSSPWYVNNNGSFIAKWLDRSQLQTIGFLHEANHNGVHALRRVVQQVNTAFTRKNYFTLSTSHWTITFAFCKQTNRAKWTLREFQSDVASLVKWRHIHVFYQMTLCHCGGRVVNVSKCKPKLRKMKKINILVIYLWSEHRPNYWPHSWQERRQSPIKGWKWNRFQSAMKNSHVVRSKRKDIKLKDEYVLVSVQ